MTAIGASITIVSKNREDDLTKSLFILQSIINRSTIEVLVFLDGYQHDTSILKSNFPWVKWYESAQSVGASAARKRLFQEVSNNLIFGFDDDANPLNADFITKSAALFSSTDRLGIIAFEELKGLYSDDDLNRYGEQNREKQPYLCKEFIGCGYAISRQAYLQTRGYPEWIDIYGEEACLSIEILAAGYKIIHDPSTIVHHRVNQVDRTAKGYNHFRFEKQLKNTILFFLVYYPAPYMLYKLGRLLLHNLTKYGLRDKTYFKLFLFAIANAAAVFIKRPRIRAPYTYSFIKSFEQY